MLWAGAGTSGTVPAKHARPQRQKNPTKIKEEKTEKERGEWSGIAVDDPINKMPARD